MGLEAVPYNFLTGRLEDLVRWARRNSVMPATFGLACCAIEMMATGAAHYDLARFGMETFRASPRQADLMIVAGRVSQKMAPVLRQVYDQMVEPKWVISMGVCASSGGMFNNYAIVQGVDQIVPVDVYVPGCPPGPETLLHGIVTLHELIRTGELLEAARDLGVGRRGHRDRPTRRCAGRPRHPRAGERLTMADAPDAPSADEAREEEHKPAVAWDEVAAALCERFEGAVFHDSHGQAVVYVDRSHWSDAATMLRDDEQFTTCLDVTAVDHLVDADRVVVAGVVAERFEIVANFLSHARNRRIRVIAPVPVDDPQITSLTPVYPGLNFAEREVYDLFGIEFPGHPELTRILMPDDWVGHPLRKDDAPARVPVTFKGDPGPR